MKRSLLFIFMTIGLVASFIGGATFAPFSDETTGIGDVTAGVLAFSGNGTQSFDFPTNDFCTEMAVGDTCEGTFHVVNDGSLTGVIVDTSEAGGVQVAAEVTDVDDPTSSDGICTPEMWIVSAISVDNNGYTESDSKFVPDDDHKINVSVELDGGNEEINACQGASATVEVTVTVEQYSDPHDTNDSV